MIAVNHLHHARRWGVYFLFFASGISALIYEIVWVRELTYHIGASIYAVSTVLAAFMGGLALGGWAGGRFGQGQANPLRTYAVLELGIGVSALCLKWALGAVEPLYLLVWHDYHDSFALFTALRFVLNFVLLLIPTTFMGATLPVLFRYVAKIGRDPRRGVGYFYAVNVFGSVLGCVGAGFFSIPYLGLDRSVELAAGINIVVGVIAFLLSLQARPGADSAIRQVNSIAPLQPNTALQYSRRVRGFLLAAYALSGMTALGYQILWTRSLVFLLHYGANTTYTFTSILSTFLVGLTAGCALINRFIAKIRDPLSAFALIQILMAFCAVMSLLVISRALPDHDLLYLVDYINVKSGEISWAANMVNIYAHAVVVILPTTLLMGMSFPLAVRVSVSAADRTGYGVGKLYFVNTLGAIAGCLVTGFVLIALVGVARSFLIFAIVNTFSGVLLLAMNEAVPAGKRILRTAVMVSCMVALIIWQGGTIVYQRVYEGEKLAFYKEGPLDTVSVVQDQANDSMLYVDSMSVAGTSRIMLTDQKTLAHLPMLTTEKPRSALAFGFGSGGTSWSLLRYKELEKMDVVEISPTVPEAAPYLERSNHGLLRAPVDPRFRLIRDDARNYLRVADERYDIIEIDCTDLRYKENGSLYSLEFFDLSRKRLTPNGVVTVWMPLGKLSIPVFTSVLHTFHRVFPYITVWYFHNVQTHFVLLQGSMKPQKIDYARMMSRLDDPDVRADLAEIGLDDPREILGSFVTDQEYLGKITSGSILNTEDFPYVEFFGPRYRYSYGNRALIDNLELLMNGRKSVVPYLRNIPAEEKENVMTGLKKIESELPWILRERTFEILYSH